MLVQNKPGEALKKLEPILSRTKNPLESPFVSEAYERFTRAELLSELGRDRESLALLDHLVESSVFEFVYLPLSHLRRAEALNRVGDVKGAAAGYRAFLVLWGDCDPELKPMVELARRKLDGLAAGAQGPPSKRRPGKILDDRTGKTEARFAQPISADPITPTDIARWTDVARARGEVFGKIRRAATLVQVSALVDPRLLVERLEQPA